MYLDKNYFDFNLCYFQQTVIIFVLLQITSAKFLQLRCPRLRTDDTKLHLSVQLLLQFILPRLKTKVSLGDLCFFYLLYSKKMT